LGLRLSDETERGKHGSEHDQHGIPPLLQHSFVN
jgi:hypothetical protein